MATATGEAPSRSARPRRRRDRATPGIDVDTQAMIDTINAVIKADTVEVVIRSTLDTLQSTFGWAYASYWKVEPR